MNNTYRALYSENKENSENNNFIKIILKDIPIQGYNLSDIFIQLSVEDIIMTTLVRGHSDGVGVKQALPIDVINVVDKLDNIMSVLTFSPAPFH